VQVSQAGVPGRYLYREPKMDRLNRYNSELNLVAWAALLLLVILILGH
jgi:hypothetical protein